jgi:hypothetical protein
VKASIRSAWVAARPAAHAGLRREEVAMLADVGVTWYTWLEQGGTSIRRSRDGGGGECAAVQPAETRHLLCWPG